MGLLIYIWHSGLFGFFNRPHVLLEGADKSIHYRSLDG